MCHCFFLFCIPDSGALSLCFLSTITSFLHHIVLSVVWRDIYKDSVHPLAKKRKMHSDKFISVQSKPNPVYHQLCKPKGFPYLSSIGRKKRKFSLLLICSPWSSLLKRVLPSIHPVSTGSHNHPPSIPFSLFIHLIS